MKKSKDASTDAAELRRLAEARLKERSAPSAVTPPEEAQRLVQELQVHQIELELQNEELAGARAEAEAGLERYTELYDYAPVGYLTLGPEGAIRKVNLTGAQLLRRERARLVGGRLGLLVAHESRAAFNAFLERVFAGTAREACDVALGSESDDPRWAHLEAVRSADAEDCRAVIMDITERHRLEETMRFRLALTEYAATHSLEELITKTLDQIGALTGSPVGFFHLVEPDQVTLSLQGWSTRTVKEFCTAPGRGRRYPLDQAGVWADCVRERRPVIHNDYAALPHRRGLPEGHAAVTREVVVPVMRQDRIVAVAGVGNKRSDYTDRDVEIVTFLADVAWAMIERKRADEALRLSEQLFRNLFGSMNEGFALCEMIYDHGGSPTDFRYLQVNAAFARLTDLPVEEVQGRTVRELIPGIESHWIEAYGRVVQSGRAERIENPVAALGRRYEVHAWRADAGRFAAVFTDVTERKRAEEAIKDSEQRAQRAAEALREADRNKDQFLAVLSHELRNPLAPIHNSLYVLERAAPGGEQARRAHAVIDRQVGQLTRLVDDLLDVTRISRGKIRLQREPLDLREVVLRAVDDHRAAFVTNGVELDVEVADALVRVDGDRTRLAQVVGNLLTNAAKFTPRGKRTLIALQGDAGAAEAIIRVRDTGAGIAADMLPRLFEAFVQVDRTLDRSRGGLGLGLALVKGLVEMHGGAVAVTSDGPGRGAEFTVRLPLARAAAVSPAAPAPATPGRAVRRRVLIIEDNLDAGESLREVLLYDGHEVEVARDGCEGLEKARQFRPEVVLCDIGLPFMDGYEVATALRADPELATVFLVALTGYASPEEVARAREVGFDAHLAKPPSLERLRAALAEAPARDGGAAGG
jgi:signal transduction histidine kinase/CheY-like chemotaxis protein